MKFHTYISAEKDTVAKQDRRRKFNEGDEIVRFTVSIPSSLMDKILDHESGLNMSQFVRDAIESYFLTFEAEDEPS